MKNNRILWVAMMSVCLLFAANVQSQSLDREVVASSGSYDSTSAGSISWTLGEPVIDTYTGVDYSLTQGFQQPDLLSVSVFELPETGEGFSIFPNPVKDLLTLKCDQPKVFMVGLFDVNGKLLVREETTPGSDLTINLKPFAQAGYFLNIYNADNKLVKSFKLIKAE
ncbi:MAG: T9SS type A sorting domain-containing protein [Bacteroidetes bacterium]|nr:T9SS type A sorting domain-containing protein [Bacteroidota bacterium]MBU1720830.1 T9SS type A sorting domain-containing protein [Bacteroidota bacterium]